MSKKIQDPVSFATHFAGALLALAGTLFFAFRGRYDRATLFSLLVYGASATFLFSASSLYHALKKEENGNSLLRKLDHIAIFFMIAGTYMPLCYVYLEGGWRWGIIIAQWSLVLFGLFFKFFWMGAPRALSAGIYILMGWIAVIPIHKFWNSMPAGLLGLILAGGLSYTAGAIIYARKSPDPVPGTFGFHEIFHLFILAGAAFHFAGIAAYVPRA